VPAAGANPHLARALVAEARLAHYQEDLHAARASAERGLALAVRLEDPACLANALGVLAFWNSMGGDLAVARRFAQATVDAARRAGDPWLLAWALHVWGQVLRRSGDLAAAQPALEESLALFRETGDERGLASPLTTLGIVATARGDYARARQLHETVHAIGRALDDPEVQVKSLDYLAALACLSDSYAQAQALYQKVVSDARELGLTGTLARGLRGLGQVGLAGGHWHAAAGNLWKSLQLEQQRQYVPGVALSLAALGRVAAATGQARTGARLLGAAQATFDASGRVTEASDHIELKRSVDVVRAQLEPAEFEAAWAEGGELTLEQAIAAALSCLPVADHSPAIVPAPGAPAASPPLRLVAFGATRVFRGEQALAEWPYAKVKELLFFLAAHPARTKAQIGLALWPDASPSQLRNSLGMALYHLRRALGQPDWVVFEAGQYRFNRSKHGWFDVDAFEVHLAHVRAPVAAPEQTLAHLEQAVALYQGDFAEDLVEGDWFLLRREALRRKYLDTLLGLGEHLFARGDYLRAAGAYRQAIEKDEVLEAAHRELMRCYARLGERGQALRHYQTLVDLMRAELGADPARETRLLYEQLHRGDSL
jgi:DNA-binding SARP family transcriptional activator